MKQFLTGGLLAAALLVSTNALAEEVILLKAGETAPASEEESNRRRYNRDLASMNNTSDQIAYQIFNKRAHPDVVAANKGDNLQVRLIKVRR